MSGTEAENLHMLAALQPLQKNLPPVSEPHRIPILVRFSAQLHKDHFLGRIHIEPLLQVLGDIAQQQARAGRHTDGRSFLGPQSPPRCIWGGQANCTRRKTVSDQLFALYCQPVWNTSQRIITHGFSLLKGAAIKFTASPPFLLSPEARTPHHCAKEKPLPGQIRDPPVPTNP